jgi:hypothetical protein
MSFEQRRKDWDRQHEALEAAIQKARTCGDERFVERLTEPGRSGGWAVEN